MVQPDLILTPFGENANPGTINEIPETLSPSDPVQSASWNAGFPQVTMTPLSAGGIPPRGQDVNGALRAISRHVAFLGGGGQYKWSSAYVSKNGGYAIGDVIQANDGLNSYVSLIDANTFDFNSTPASIGTSWGLYSGQSLIQQQATEVILGIIRLTTTALALAGTNDSTAMTPLKTKLLAQQLIDLAVVAATESRAGIIKIATYAQALAGTDDLSAMTALKARTAIQATTIGAGQARQNMIASRSLGTVYTNSTGRPIEVIASIFGGTGSETATVNINGFVPYTGDPGYGTTAMFSFVVLNGESYMVDVNPKSGATLVAWTEVR